MASPGYLTYTEQDLKRALVLRAGVKYILHAPFAELRSPLWRSLVTLESEAESMMFLQWIHPRTSMETGLVEVSRPAPLLKAMLVPESISVVIGPTPIDVFVAMLI